MYIDTHAHVNFNAFKDDGDDVILRSLEGDTKMVLVGSNYKTSKRALDYANKFEKGVYAAVGLHPIHVEGVSEEAGEEFNYEIFEKIANSEKTVAIGEVGLDYFHIKKGGDEAAAKEKQKEVFLSQLFLARKYNLPAIIHCREAHADMIEVLENFRKENKELIPKDRPWAVMHCFSGDEDMAWKYFSLGVIISFTGLITFSQNWDDLIRKVPLENIMIETDCPYMTPVPYRGERNEPILVKYVANRIAEIKNLSLDRVAEVTSATAKRFFNI